MQRSLAALCIESAQLLNKLCTLLRDPKCATRSSLRQAVVEDQADRFRVWGGNLGAFQQLPAPTSLDFRLRESPEVARQIQEILQDLQDTANSGIKPVKQQHVARNLFFPVLAIASGVQLNRQIDPDDDEAFRNDGADEISEADQKSDGGHQPPLSEAEELVESVKESISSLFRMSIIIRKASPRDRFAKAQTVKQTPFNDGFDIAHVGQKYPKLAIQGKAWLKERLGKAITQRRQFLRYARDHKDQLAKGTQEVWTPPDETSKLSSSMPLANSKEHSQAGETNMTRLTSTLAPTAASTLRNIETAVFPDWDAEDNQSQTSYAASNGNDEKSGVKLPRLSEVSKGANTFECPFCWGIQSIRRESAWKKHVLTDLRPYLCTFEKCDSKLFSDRKDWFEHELKCHRAQWHCHFCKRTDFHSLELFQEHLRRHHARDVTDDQLAALGEASRVPVEGILALDCPFCNEWEERLRQSNPQITVEEKVLVTPLQFRQHVASHMQHLALFAIPRGYLEDDADGKSAASNDAAAASEESSTPGAPRAVPSQVASPGSDQSYATQPDTSSPNGDELLDVEREAEITTQWLAMCASSSPETLEGAVIDTLPRLSSGQLERIRDKFGINVQLRSLAPERLSQIAYVTSLGQWGSYAYWLEQWAMDNKRLWSVVIQILVGRTITEYQYIDKSLGQDYGISIMECIEEGFKHESSLSWLRGYLQDMVRQGKVPSADSMSLSELENEVSAFRTYLVQEPESDVQREWVVKNLLSKSNRDIRAIVREYDRRYAPNRLLLDVIDSSQPIYTLLVLHVINGALTAARRDARFIQQTLNFDSKSLATEDFDMLAFILIRLHWNKSYLQAVKDEFERNFGHTLENALLDTLPDDSYRLLCLGLVQTEPETDLDSPSGTGLQKKKGLEAPDELERESKESAILEDENNATHFQDPVLKVLFIQRLWRMNKKRKVLQELVPTEKPEDALSKDSPLIKELGSYTTFQEFPDLFTTMYPHFVIELYQPGQIILKSGTSCPWICWVMRGTVILHSPSGAELLRLEEGSCFGDVGTLLDVTQIADIRSKEHSVVVQLRKRDLLSGLRAHPEAKAVWEKRAQESLTQTELLLAHQVRRDMRETNQVHHTEATSPDRDLENGPFDEQDFATTSQNHSPRSPSYEPTEPTYSTGDDRTSPSRGPVSPVHRNRTYSTEDHRSTSPDRELDDGPSDSKKSS